MKEVCRSRRGNKEKTDWVEELVDGNRMKNKAGFEFSKSKFGDEAGCTSVI